MAKRDSYKSKGDAPNELVVDYSGVILSTKLNLTDGSKVPSMQSKDELLNTSKSYVPWGANDDFPNHLRKEAESDTIILPGIRIASRFLYGGGLAYGKLVVNEGKRDWQYARDMEIEKWLRNSNVARQLMTIFHDIVFYANAFPMFTMSIDGKKIARISTQHSRAPWCRLSAVNTYGEHEHCFINPDRGTTSDNATNDGKKLKCAPQFGAVEWVREKISGGESFIVPIKAIDGGRQNYALPDWESARKMLWVKIGKDIARLNQAYLNNAMRPMWHVEVHPEFWKKRFGDELWDTLDAKQKIAKINEFHQDLHNKLSGVDNASTYISTPLSHVRGFEHQAFSLVKITYLENKTEKGKDGWYLTTSREAGQHKVVSLGLDSAIMGTIPGDAGMGAGSGSNNRVAFNQRVLMSNGDQTMYLNFMYMVAEINGWDPELEFIIEQGLITTLDAGAEASSPQPPANNKAGANG